MPEHLDDENKLEALAGNTSRRGFLARLGAGLLAASGGSVIGSLVQPGDADSFHFCGHTYTTGSCPHPAGLPRIDSRGYPLRPSDGVPIDDLGRPTDDLGRPIDGDGRLLLEPDGRPVPPAPRTRVCDRVRLVYGMKTSSDGSWYRCCGGKVRKLVDCCSHSSRRINGDAALTGYCFRGRKVFCVQYYDTQVPC
ncbi:MAG: twin-arginine translocation signal domain-containing protein [Solirubrobacterales bacterium]